jgi:septal ring factor EnvC (AmiA/AmiB activator)
MNSEVEYSYAEPAPSGPSLHLPFALLSSALALVMISQTIGTMNQKSDLREGRTQLGENSQKLAEAITKRQPLVAQSQQLKQKLNEMIMDILTLAKTDEDAKAIVTKYNIQQNLPASGDAAPAAPAPAR